MKDGVGLKKIHASSGEVVRLKREALLRTCATNAWLLHITAVAERVLLFH